MDLDALFLHAIYKVILARRPLEWL